MGKAGGMIGTMTCPKSHNRRAQRLRFVNQAVTCTSVQYLLSGSPLQV